MDLAKITTEQVNANSQGIDQKSTAEILEIINAEDQKVALAVHEAIPEIARAVDAIYERFHQGGRLIYIGSGTSGRMGVLDAAECPPTYGTDPSRIFAIMAGGKDAVFVAVEGAEDDREQGALDLASHDLQPLDCVVGIAASGRTPYVLGALDYANEQGNLTVAVSAVKDSPVAQAADFAITPQTGPEVVTGSTRMKSGTAQKLVLNMITTTLMIKMGKVYGNLMVDLKATNLKLHERAHRLLETVTGCSRAESTRLLETSQMNVKLAIVMYWHDMTTDEAQEALRLVDGKLSLLEPRSEGTEGVAAQGEAAQYV